MTLLALQGQLIVSCQPVSGGPMDRTDIIVAFARAALLGGAAGLRVEGTVNVAAVRQMTDAPLIGLIKRDVNGQQRITHSIADVQSLIAAGADIIAFDATQRPRPCTVAALIEAIHAGGQLAMADCSCELDGETAFHAGADVLGSTLAGYTGGVVPTEPDVDLLVALRRFTPHVIAEGRYNTPEKAALAVSHGAWAVVVGSAITRTEHVTGWFAEAIRHVSVPCEVDQ